MLATEYRFFFYSEDARRGVHQSTAMVACFAWSCSERGYDAGFGVGGALIGRSR